MLLLLAAAVSCGSERVLVKTLSDPVARGLHRTQPTKTTVADLALLPPPPHWSPSLLRLPGERRLYSVIGHVVGAKHELDNDFHVVLGAGRDTMVVEFPDPRCTSKSYAPGLQAQARVDLLRVVSKPGSDFHVLPPAERPCVRVTGPLFFDKVHGQVGVAKNGAEIHPVLRVEALDEKECADHGVPRNQ